MEEQPNTTRSPFDPIRQTDSGTGREYWDARDLGKLPGYAKYDNFIPVIKKACQESGEAVADHIPHMRNMMSTGKGAKRSGNTVQLSRYACYLVIENSDPTNKPIVALGQTYFSAQTRRQELTDEQALADLPEDENRLISRREMAVLNLQLAEAAKLCVSSNRNTLLPSLTAAMRACMMVKQRI